MKLDGRHVGGGLVLLVAAGVAYLATRSAGPVKMTQYTESRQGPLQEHLVTEEELGGGVPLTPHRYPSRIAPGLDMCLTHGYAPLYQLADPVAAALPAERG
jgi:hypothetical protein